MQDLFSRRAAILLCTVSMLYVTFAVACNVVAFKVVSVFSLPIIGASILFPLTYAFMDFIAELYGNFIAKIIIWFHVVCDFFFIYLIYWISHLPSPDFWVHQEAYNTVVDPMTRLYMANLAGIIISSLFNIFILSKLRIFTKGKFYAARSFISTGMGITVYTTITNFLAFSAAYSGEILNLLTLTNLISNLSCALLYACVLSLFIKPAISLFDAPNNYKPVKLFE